MSRKQIMSALFTLSLAFVVSGCATYSMDTGRVIDLAAIEPQRSSPSLAVDVEKEIEFLKPTFGGVDREGFGQYYAEVFDKSGLFREVHGGDGGGDLHLKIRSWRVPDDSKPTLLLLSSITLTLIPATKVSTYITEVDVYRGEQRVAHYRYSNDIRTTIGLTSPLFGTPAEVVGKAYIARNVGRIIHDLNKDGLLTLSTR